MSNVITCAPTTASCTTTASTFPSPTDTPTAPGMTETNVPLYHRRLSNLSTHIRILSTYKYPHRRFYIYVDILEKLSIICADARSAGWGAMSWTRKTTPCDRPKCSSSSRWHLTFVPCSLVPMWLPTSITTPTVVRSHTHSAPEASSKRSLTTHT